MGLVKPSGPFVSAAFYENNDGEMKALVVCPTTLIYNWENEIKKVYAVAGVLHSSWPSAQPAVG
jgi:hypothetical protein